MFPPIPRICIWVCLFFLAFLFGDGGLSAWAETSHGPGGVKVIRYPNMDAPGNDAPWVRGIANVEQCESLCLADTACAGYTYNINKSTCIPKTIIGPLSPTREPAVTGIVDRRSGGLEAQNRAIAVEGKPSFDCRKAKSETAQAICGSTNLIQLDLQLAKLYWAKMAKLKGSSADDEQHRQYDWGVLRNQCGADAACVEQRYQRRIAELGGQIQVAAPPPSQAPQDRKMQPGVDAGIENDATTVGLSSPGVACDGQSGDDVHRAICASSNLGNLDAQLGQIYRIQLARLQATAADAERGRQRDWIAAGKRCGPLVTCLEGAYESRISQLVDGLGFAKQIHGEISGDPLPRPPTHLIGKADQPCDVAAMTLTRLRKGLSISVPDGPTVQAESLRDFIWKVSGALPQGPAYLVLAADGAVRFQATGLETTYTGNGYGLYALMPDAAAPFRIKQLVKYTRVIIPLHVKGAPTSGELKIRPLIVGPLKISAAIIGYTQCGENPDPAPIVFDLTVEPGAPEIVIADRFDLAKPDQIIASPDGTRRLEVYGPRYRLIDVATGALLADDIGTEPRFSPTGRFVIARMNHSSGEEFSTFQIRDTVDGKLSQEILTGADVAWDNRDSFIISGIGEGIGDPLLDGNGSGYAQLIASFGEIDPPRWHDIQASSFKIDLENNIYVGGLTSSDAASLTAGKGIIVKDQQQAGSLAETGIVDSLADEGTQVVAFSKPEHWEMIDGLKFTHIDRDYWNDRKTDDDKRFAVALKRFVVRPIIISPDDAQSPFIDKDHLRVASRGLNEVNLPVAEVALRHEQRLRDFGIEINSGASFIRTEKTHVSKAIIAARNDSLQFIEDPKIRIKQSVLHGYSCGKTKPSEVGTLELLVPLKNFFVIQIEFQGNRLTLFSAGCELGQESWSATYLHDSRHLGKLFPISAPEMGGIDPPIEAGLFFTRYLVLWNRRGSAAVYDIEKQKQIYELVDLPSPFVTQRMSLSRDLKTLTKLDKDGGFQVIALKPAQRDKEGHLRQDSTKVDILLSGRIVDDEVVVWTPSGQFDSTAEGASHVALRFPGRSGEYTLDQFQKLFHQNDLLNRALAGEAFKAPVVKTFPPSITVKPAFTADTVAAKIDGLGDDPVDEIRIYQDGLMTNVVPVTTSAKTIDVNAKRLPGARWVAFLARGPSGLFAQPVTFDAGQFPGARRRVHIVSVGIDHYDDEKIQQLRFAGSDAARFLKALQDKAGTSVEIVSQTLLRDAEASREAILAKLNETIAKAEPGDSILLFIAGHGVKAPDKNYYLATSVTRVDNIENTSLRWSDLSNALAKAHSRIAVFLDTCNSGAAGTDFFTTNDASVSALLDRAPSGILIFSASKGREESEESAGQGGGVFTSAVIAALSDPKSDRNHNGVIEASELYATVKRAVVEATEGRQTPWFARNDMVGDFVPF